MDSASVAIVSVVVSGAVGISAPYLSARFAARAAERQLALQRLDEKDREARDVLDRGARLLEGAFWSLDRAHRAGRLDPAKGAEVLSEVTAKRLPAVSRGGARIAIRLGTGSETVRHYDDTQTILRRLAHRIEAEEVELVDLLATEEWEQAVAAQKQYLDSAKRIVGLPEAL